MGKDPAHRATGSAEVPKRRPGRPRLEGPSPDFLARREEIVAAAAEVFHQKGYDAGTLEDVAEALDLRRASLYYYVRSKQYLLYLIFDDAFTRVLATLDELLTIDDPAERLEALIRLQIQFVTGDQSFFGVLFDHRIHLDEQYEAEIRRGERKVFRVYYSVVESAIQAGLLTDMDPLYATHAIIGMTTWVYKWWRNDDHDREAFESACIALVLDGRRGVQPIKRRRKPAV